MMSPAEYAPARHDDGDAPYREPLSGRAKLCVLAAVIFFHVGGAWALMEIQPNKIEVGEAASMEVRMVPAELPPAPQLDIPPPEDTPPPEPEPVQIDTPPPLDTPPPEVPMLEAAVSPPTPDLPPPEFKMAAPPPPKPKPKPKPPPRPRPPVPVEAAPQPAPPQAHANAAPVPVEKLGYLNAPNPIYSARSRRNGEKGTVTMRVVVDSTGRPVEVTLARSSGHAALDEAALRAMRAARIKPIGRLITVTASITFNLQ
jgi:protein TonB